MKRAKQRLYTLYVFYPELLKERLYLGAWILFWFVIAILGLDAMGA